MPGKRAEKLRDVGGEARDQASGTLSNARQAASAFTLDNILPDALVSLLSEVFDTTAKAAGRDSQAMGMTSAITLIILGILTSWAYIGFIGIAVGGVLFVYNAIRLVPAANRYHKKAGRKVGLYKDRDIPLWKRD